MLKLLPAEPVWLDIAEGVSVQMSPIGPKAFRAAQAACLAVLGSDDPDQEEASDAISGELIRRGLLDWKGILGADDKPLPLTPAAIEMFLVDPRTFLPTVTLYVIPFLMRDAEGNASAGSPDGTGTKAMPAPTIAGSRANRTRRGGAKRARTASTNAAPSKAKPSGE